MNNKTSLGNSFRRINTPKSLVNYLHSDSCSDSCSNNELTITESDNSEESTADNNTPSTHADIQNPQNITKHSDKAFMNMEATFSALKGYIDSEIPILNSKVDLLIESLKKTITKKEKRERNNKEILQENIRFLQKELLAKNDLIKNTDGNSNSCIRGYN